MPPKAQSAAPAKAVVDLVNGAYEGEPAVPERKKKTPVAAPTESQSSTATEGGANAFTFTLPASLVGEKTSAQIKARLNTDLFGYGVIDEIRVTNSASTKETDAEAEAEAEAETESKDKTVVAFFSKVLSKGFPVFEGLEKDEEQKVKLFDTEVVVSKFDGKASGGGRASKTAHKKSDKKDAGAGRGGRGGRGGAGGADRGGRGGRGRGN